ncbi:BrnT family toxin [Caballeronia sp. LZ043]|uniref:BrnT family toxin n=1 Tax=Caballeronia sp. LZ043 TaxID=3038569 RepID=UPI00285E51FD|nr:BrnT family toxin [Caballeronia sp. LZ043]MDR5825807.1 BrnT family toxin [Caballeronia sp. LZ043]
MDITYDPPKDEANIGKHGLSLKVAEMIDWSEVMSYVDTRRDYKEVREVGFAPIGTRLYCVVFTQRGETMHVISLRKANDREVRNYAQYD